MASPAPDKLFSAVFSDPAHADVSETIKLLSQDAQLAAFLDNRTELITVFLPSNLAYADVHMEAMVSDNSAADREKLMYLMLCGFHSAESLLGSNTSFFKTLLYSQGYSNVSVGAAVMEAFTDTNGTHLSGGLHERANITQKNIPFRNGIAHVIDHLIIPPHDISTTGIILNITSLASFAAPGTIPQVDIQSAPTITIFAPSNAALAKYKFDHDGAQPLPSEYQALVVNDGTVHYSTTLNQQTQLTTIGGRQITITVARDGIKVNYANILQSDILTGNGVVHIIDQVLI